MKKVLTLGLLALSVSACQPANANQLNGSNSASTSVAEGSVYVNSSQYNPMFGNNLPSTVIGKDYSSCPTSTLSVAAMPSHSNDDWGGNNNTITFGLSLDMPLDWEGAISRCEDHQVAQKIQLETANISNILAVCMQAKREGFVLDPKVIPMAKYCKGIKHEHPSASYIKAQNEFLRDRVDHVEEHHFKKKITTGNK